MICYKDITFCTFYEDCKDAKECHRALTPEVIKQANEWMKNPPIATFMEKPECHNK
jgi:hypothetical protein